MAFPGLRRNAIATCRANSPFFSYLQYTAAAKTAALEPTARAMENLASVFKRDAKLKGVLMAPTLSAEDKRQIIAELQKHTGSADKGDVVKNFLKTLADNNRLGVLESVSEKFGVLMSAARGEVELVVTSAAVGFWLLSGFGVSPGGAAC